VCLVSFGLPLSLQRVHSSCSLSPPERTTCCLSSYIGLCAVCVDAERAPVRCGGNEGNARHGIPFLCVIYYTVLNVYEKKTIPQSMPTEWPCSEHKGTEWPCAASDVASMTLQQILLEVHLKMHGIMM